MAVEKKEVNVATRIQHRTEKRHVIIRVVPFTAAARLFHCQQGQKGGGCCLSESIS